MTLGAPVEVLSMRASAPGFGALLREDKSSRGILDKQNIQER
jgi:hypothetical protein